MSDLAVSTIAPELPSLGQGVAASPLGLFFDDGLEPERWEEVGQTIAALANASQWWIGDWVNYGEAEYGEKYADALAATGLAYDTLRHIASTCERIEIGRRRPKLSFSHHVEVAPLPARAQDTWLIRAETEGLSVAALRAQLRSKQRLPASKEPGLVRFVLQFPEDRATRWERQAEEAGRPFEEWAADVLDAACEIAEAA